MRLSPQRLGFARGDTMTANLRSWWQKSMPHSWLKNIGSRLRGLGQTIQQHLIATGVIINLVVIVVLIVLSVFPSTGFSGKTLWDWLNLLGVLNIPIVVGLGTVWITQIQGQRDKQLAEQQKKLETQRDFIRRVREAEATIEDARELMEANDSGRTWVEQLVQLRLLNREVGQIYQDLEFSPQLPQLFTDQEVIRSSHIGVIKLYLDKANAEYDKFHSFVDQSAQNKKKLKDIIKDSKEVKGEEMTWTDDFIKGGHFYFSECSSPLSTVKRMMIVEVYGA
jgi:hypothetical protein